MGELGGLVDTDDVSGSLMNMEEDEEDVEEDPEEELVSLSASLSLHDPDGSRPFPFTSLLHCPYSSTHFTSSGSPSHRLALCKTEACGELALLLSSDEGIVTVIFGICIPKAEVSDCCEPEAEAYWVVNIGAWNWGEDLFEAGESGELPASEAEDEDEEKGDGARTRASIMVRSDIRGRLTGYFAARGVSSSSSSSKALRSSASCSSCRMVSRTSASTLATEHLD